MPKQTINYDNTHFYKICCKDIDVTDIYVGATTDFIRRKSQHKTRCCNEKAKDHYTYKYQTIRDNGGWDNWSMVLIETKKCEDALQVRKLERNFIEQLKASLNKQIPGRTKEEFAQDNKEKIAEYHKTYYEGNKDIINERKKKYYEANKEKCLEQMRQYNEANKAKFSAYYKNYYQNKKVKLEPATDENN